jgi:hydroxymethylpyrimidine/phosphomethylpyrimidine kinase
LKSKSPASAGKGRPGPPVVLTVAGSDNSSGAGIQADLRTVESLGCFALTAVTCVVAEIPGKVTAIQPVQARVVREQIRLSLAGFPVAAIKTGMLFSRSIISAVVAEIASARGIPLVVDPVMIASSGDPLLRPDAIRLYRQRLLPLATLITPNIDELAFLSGRSILTVDQMEAAGRQLVNEFGCSVLCKGGHLQADPGLDLLITPESIQVLRGTFRKGAETHGSGCTYSAAIAAGLAGGLSLSGAVVQGKRSIQKAIDCRYRWRGVEALAIP